MKTLRLFACALVIALGLITFLPDIVSGPDEGSDPGPVALDGSPLNEATKPVEPIVSDAEPSRPTEETAAAEVPATLPVALPAAEPEQVALPTETQPRDDAAEPEAAPVPAEPEVAIAPATPDPAVDDEEIVSVDPGPMTRAEIAAAPPSNLSPHGFLSDIYSFERSDEISDEQRAAVTRGIVGKMVEWELTLFNTSEGDDGGVILMSAGADQAEVFCKIPEVSGEEMAAVRRLAPGDRFTCKGQIAGTFIRNLVIEPAILMTGQPGL